MCINVYKHILRYLDDFLEIRLFLLIMWPYVANIQMHSIDAIYVHSTYQKQVFWPLEPKTEKSRLAIVFAMLASLCCLS